MCGKEAPSSDALIESVAQNLAMKWHLMFIEGMLRDLADGACFQDGSSAPLPADDQLKIGDTVTYLPAGVVCEVSGYEWEQRIISTDECEYYVSRYVLSCGITARRDQLLRRGAPEKSLSAVESAGVSDGDGMAEMARELRALRDELADMKAAIGDERPATR